MCRARRIRRRSRFPRSRRRTRRNFVNIPDDIIDFTPELRAQALSQLSRYKPGPLFNPPILGQARWPARLAEHRQSWRRHELAGRRLRSGDAHCVRAGVELRDQRPLARDAAGGILGHSLRARCHRPAVRGSVRAWRLLRRRFPARHRAGRSRGGNGSDARCSGDASGRGDGHPTPFGVCPSARWTDRAGASDHEAALRRARGDSPRSR